MYIIASLPTVLENPAQTRIRSGQDRPALRDDSFERSEPYVVKSPFVGGASYLTINDPTNNDPRYNHVIIDEFQMNKVLTGRQRHDHQIKDLLLKAIEVVGIEINPLYLEIAKPNLIKAIHELVPMGGLSSNLAETLVDCLSSTDNRSSTSSEKDEQAFISAFKVNHGGKWVGCRYENTPWQKERFQIKDKVSGQFLRYVLSRQPQIHASPDHQELRPYLRLLDFPTVVRIND